MPKLRQPRPAPAHTCTRSHLHPLTPAPAPESAHAAQREDEDGDQVTSDLAPPPPSLPPSFPFPLPHPLGPRSSLSSSPSVSRNRSIQSLQSLSHAPSFPLSLLRPSVPPSLSPWLRALARALAPSSTPPSRSFAPSLPRSRPRSFFDSSLLPFHLSGTRFCCCTPAISKRIIFVLLLYSDLLLQPMHSMLLQQHLGQKFVFQSKHIQHIHRC